MTRELYSVEQAGKLMGLPRQTIDFLIRAEIIDVVQERPNRPRSLTNVGLMALGLYRALSRAGAGLAAIKPFCRHLFDLGEDGIEAAFEVGRTCEAGGGEVGPRLVTPAELCDLTTESPVLWAIDLAACAAQLHQGLEQRAALAAAPNN